MKPVDLLVVSELYHPEMTSTGYFVTGIAEGLAAREGYRVTVVCSQPTYALQGVRAPAVERRNGVEIHRVPGNRGHKDRVAVKIWAMVYFVFAFSRALFKHMRRGQVVLILTNPPTLPFVAGWVARWKGARTVLLLHDLFPDITVPGDVLRAGSPAYRLLDVLQRAMMRRMGWIVVLGRDARERVAAKLGWDPEGEDARRRLRVISNWGDPEKIRPGLRDGNRVRERISREGGWPESVFVVQYSGNIGRTSGVEDFVELAGRMRSEPRVRFMVFGKGASYPWLARRCESLGLVNVKLLGPCEEHELGEYLTAADLSMVIHKKGMAGISVPSRTYNMMAAAVPILAVTDPGSEVARMVRESGMGWTARSGDPDSVERALRAALSVSPEERRGMGAKGRARLLASHTRDWAVDRYDELIRGEVA